MKGKPRAGQTLELKPTTEAGPTSGECFRPVEWETFISDRPFLVLILNTFLVDYLEQVYKLFEGDILQALVLGAVAHHNILHLAERKGYDQRELQNLLDVPTDGREQMVPCNAFSISEAMDLPRETVRRKVAELLGRGWLRRNETKELYVTELPIEFFSSFNHQVLNEFLKTAERLRQRLAATSPSAP